MRRRLATLAAVPLLLALLAPVASVSAASTTITVHPGESIQAAITKAPSGGTVVVQRGTYMGNLDIKRSVHLVGQNAVIVPAAKTTQNACVALMPGMVLGICAHGAFKSDGSMASSISNVSIEGFTVRNFSGPGIVAAGVKGFRASRNVTAHNGLWGIDVAASSNISLLDNASHGNGSDGIHVDSSPAANAVIVGNASYGNVGAGILFFTAIGGRIAMNDVHDNCVGIAVGASGDPTGHVDGAGDVAIELNRITANDRLCPDQSAQGGPAAYGGIGIALIGAKNAIVELNDIRNNVEQAGSGITGGGIVLLDGKMFGATAPTGNSIRLNRLSGNGPNDIYGDGAGTGNTINGNACTKSNLPGAC